LGECAGKRRIDAGGQDHHYDDDNYVIDNDYDDHSAGRACCIEGSCGSGGTSDGVICCSKCANAGRR
jgi:hypothetical protein